MFRNFLKACYFSLTSFFKHPNQWLGAGPSLTILTYHRILPCESEAARFEQPGMSVSPQTFRLNIQWLKSRNYKIISLDEWVSVRDKKQSGKYAAITFDDGWKDNLENALPVLKDENCSATIYVVSDKISDAAFYWPTVLGSILCRATTESRNRLFDENDFLESVRNNIKIEFLHGCGVDQASDPRIDEYIESCKHYRDDELESAISELILSSSLHSDQAILLNERDVLTLVASGHFNLGSHTDTHLRLTSKVSSQELSREIERSKEKLSEQFGQTISTFCYPNGDYTDEALDLVRRSYDIAVTTESGINSVTSDLHLLKRFTMHEGLSSKHSSFFSRLHGWV